MHFSIPWQRDLKLITLDTLGMCLTVLNALNDFVINFCVCVLYSVISASLQMRVTLNDFSVLNKG